MNWFENLLIIAGIGLDIFAAFEVQGAMVASIKKKPVVIACGIVAGLQLLFYFGGYAICRLLSDMEYFSYPQEYGEGIAVIVFTLLGVRLILKAIKREFIHERLKDGIRVWDYFRIIVMANFYTFAAGCVCGLVGTTIWQIVIIILLTSIAVVIGGLYTGLHFGFEIKTITYVIGAVLLWAVGAEIFFARIIDLI